MDTSVRRVSKLLMVAIPANTLWNLRRSSRHSWVSGMNHIQARLVNTQILICILEMRNILPVSSQVLASLWSRAKMDNKNSENVTTYSRVVKNALPRDLPKPRHVISAKRMDGIDIAVEQPIDVASAFTFQTDRAWISASNAMSTFVINASMAITN